MRPDVVVVFEELCHVVESWIVGFECLPETFCLALRCGFSNGTHDMFYASPKMGSSLLVIPREEIIRDV
jgi:hypothetical protein